MQTIDIHAAKTQFSHLVEQAAAGEEIIIVKAGKPVCRLIPLEPERKDHRKLGIATGGRLVPDDFDTMFAQKIEEIFYGERESASSSEPAQAMIARFAGCWADMSDEEFAAFEAEHEGRRRTAFGGRRVGDFDVEKQAAESEALEAARQEPQHPRFVRRRVDEADAG